MKTANIKSRRTLPVNMGDLYLLKSVSEILERPLINRGYIMALNHEGKLYSYSFAESDNPHEISELDKIIVANFEGNDSIVPIPFYVKNIIEENSPALESYLNQYFGNKHQVSKTENGFALLKRNLNGNLITSESKMFFRTEDICLPELNLKLFIAASCGNYPIKNYVIDFIK